MQRRVVEDSSRRMQALFHQLANQELTAPVLQIVNEMCASKHWNFINPSRH